MVTNVDLGMVTNIVSDGLSIGHPCCGELHCIYPLVSNRDRYCAGHAHLEKICAIIGCDAPCEADYKTCPDPSHRHLEDEYKLRDKALFQLKGQLQRAYTSQSTGNESSAIDSGEFTCEEKAATGNRKLRALFGRRRTHNEQLMVRPCGILVAHQTFYGSETTTQVIVRSSSFSLFKSGMLTVTVGYDKEDISVERVFAVTRSL